MSNNAQTEDRGQFVCRTSKGDRVPQRGPKYSEKGECVLHGQNIYRTATKIYSNMSVLTPPNIFPNSRNFYPLEGINPQKRANDWPSATRIIVKFLWRSCCCYYY